MSQLAILKFKYGVPWKINVVPKVNASFLNILVYMRTNFHTHSNRPVLYISKKLILQLQIIYTYKIIYVTKYECRLDYKHYTHYVYSL